VIYRQTRIGVNGRPFTLYKFRTMLDGAHSWRSELAAGNEMSGPIFKIARDPRVTRVGRFLRRTSLDELPQFWNVLKGDMSLVGTRPPTPEEVEQYGSAHFKRLCMRPGITGIWQTRGRTDVSDFEDIVGMDTEYLRSWSLWLDVKLILETLPAILLGKGAS
jgi:lipopolysaccharide/colanic/teichoic acid biosynthesis glycosyltransferase